MVVDENIDSTKKKCQKIVNCKKSKTCYIQYTPKCYLKNASNYMEITYRHRNFIIIIKKNAKNRQFPKAIGLEKSQKVIF